MADQAAIRDNEKRAGPPLSSYGRAQVERGKLLLQMHKNMRNTYHPLHNPNDFTYGDGITGTTRLTNALSTFLNSYFGPHLPVSPDHLIMGTGLLPMMSHVTRAVADRGEGILLAAPYYPGFDDSLAIENDIIPVGISVPPSEMNTMAELAYLENGLLESTSSER
ncbi:predicted protein [Postia placenta Mad-698-R]|nr:predicted protein [Postia placenta Mad-698-R]